MWKKIAFLLSIITALIAVSCGTPDNPPTTGSGGAEGAESSTSINPEQATITGRVVSADDQETPITGSVVLLIPSEQFKAIFTNQGLDAPFDLREFTPLSLDANAISRFGVQYIDVNSNGQYELKVSPGNYIICLANVNEPKPTKVIPATFGNCTPGLLLSAGKMYFNDMTWGEQGIGDISW